MQFLVAQNGAVIGIIVTDRIFWVQISLVDRLRGLGFTHMRNLRIRACRKIIAFPPIFPAETFPKISFTNNKTDNFLFKVCYI